MGQKSSERFIFICEWVFPVELLFYPSRDFIGKNEFSSSLV